MARKPKEHHHAQEATHARRDRVQAAHRQAVQPFRWQHLSAAPCQDRARVIPDSPPVLISLSRDPHNAAVSDVALPNPLAALWQQRAVLVCATVPFYLCYPWGAVFCTLSAARRMDGSI